MKEKLDLSEFHTLVQVVNSVDAGVIVVDDTYTITVWNRFAQAYTGLNSDKVLGKRLFDVLTELPSHWMMDRIQQVIATGASGFSSWENRPHIFPFYNFCPLTGGEEVMYQDVTFLPLYNLSGRVSHVCIKVNDVSDIAKNKSDLRDYNHELKKISSIDGLTNLLNRTHWERYYNDTFKNIVCSVDCSAALFMCDIDYFKRINDTYGHQVGDEIIKYVAKEWQTALDELGQSGRYGGEEFVAYATGVTEKQAVDLAEQIRQKISSHRIHTQGQTIRITVSIGVAMHDKAVKSSDAWLKLADDALYASKESGRNRVTLHRSEKVSAMM